MKNFKQYLYESGHWESVRRAMQQASGYAPFSPMEASLWADIVSGLSEEDFRDLFDYYIRTKNVNVLPFDKYDKMKKAATEIEGRRAVRSSSARTPRQRAKLDLSIGNILRSLRR
tara:strand:- start:454 stop:798 length:345 start_codon:yes stop_codon:yes gene_type:complete